MVADPIGFQLEAIQLLPVFWNGTPLLLGGT